MCQLPPLICDSYNAPALPNSLALAHTFDLAKTERDFPATMYSTSTRLGAPFELNVQDEKRNAKKKREKQRKNDNKNNVRIMFRV